MDLADLVDQFAVAMVPGRWDLPLALVVGGLGDLEQLTAALDAVTCSFLRLDEGVHLHRVSFAKKAVALLSISTSSRRRRFSRRNAPSSSRSSLVNPSRSPASISACSTQRRTADSIRSKSLAT